MLERFKTQFEELKGHVHTAQTPEEAAEHILAITRQVEGATIAVAQIPESIQEAVVAAAQQEHVEVMTPPYAFEDLPDAIDSADVGVTGADNAIAETGTLVEIATDDAVRLVSSLPRTHVGIFHERDIIGGLRESAGVLRQAFAEHDQNCVVSFLSGPSRTGDIEMRLTLGVHGPEIAHALILTGEAF